MSTPSEKLSGILGQLQSPGGVQPANLVKALEELLKLLQELPPGPRALDAFKKPGAWKDRPLRTDTPATPIYAQLPSAIDFENVPPAILANLQAQPDGFNSSKVTIGLLS